MNKRILMSGFMMLALSTSVLAQQKPNIIFILADDMGAGMLSCNGQPIVKTPHMDSLATEGIAFDNYYGSIFCAPARWTLLTGMHDGRVGGMANNRGGLLIEHDAGEITDAEFAVQFEEMKAAAHPIPDNEVFVAEVARQAGYKTAQFGKLDRGFLTWHERVKRFGWDFYEGLYSHVRCHGFYPPYIWRNGEKIILEGNTDPHCGKSSQDGMDLPVGKFGKTYCPDVFVESMLTYIREQGAAQRADQATKPFFIYHPTQLPHGPSAVPAIHPDYINDDRLDLSEKKYATMVKTLDHHVGLILTELKKQGLDKNTVVFLASDNGHEMYSGCFMDYKKQKSADGQKYDLLDHKFRTSECGDVFNGAGGRAGLKRSGYQGGIQCLLMVRWPGKIQPGQRTNLLSSHYDFLSTVADIAGVEAPKGKDGISYLPTLLGKPQTQLHDYVVTANNFKIMGGSSLMSQDGWKLIQDNKNMTCQLYHIAVDNEERHELSAAYPERVERMKNLLISQLNSERPDLVK